MDEDDTEFAQRVLELETKIESAEAFITKQRAHKTKITGILQGFNDHLEALEKDMEGLISATRGLLVTKANYESALAEMTKIQEHITLEETSTAMIMENPPVDQDFLKTTRQLLSAYLHVSAMLKNTAKKEGLGSFVKLLQTISANCMARARERLAEPAPFGEVPPLETFLDLPSAKQLLLFMRVRETFAALARGKAAHDGIFEAFAPLRTMFLAESGLSAAEVSLEFDRERFRPLRPAGAVQQLSAISKLLFLLPEAFAELWTGAAPALRSAALIRPLADLEVDALLLNTVSARSSRRADAPVRDMRRFLAGPLSGALRGSCRAAMGHLSHSQIFCNSHSGIVRRDGVPPWPGAPAECKAPASGDRFDASRPFASSSKPKHPAVAIPWDLDLTQTKVSALLRHTLLSFACEKLAVVASIALVQNKVSAVLTPRRDPVDPKLCELTENVYCASVAPAFAALCQKLRDFLQAIRGTGLQGVLLISMVLSDLLRFRRTFEFLMTPVQRTLFAGARAGGARSLALSVTHMMPFLASASAAPPKPPREVRLEAAGPEFGALMMEHMRAEYLQLVQNFEHSGAMLLGHFGTFFKQISSKDFAPNARVYECTVQIVKDLGLLLPQRHVVVKFLRVASEMHAQDAREPAPGTETIAHALKLLTTEKHGSGSELNYFFCFSKAVLFDFVDLLAERAKEKYSFAKQRVFTLNNRMFCHEGFNALTKPSLQSSVRIYAQRLSRDFELAIRRDLDAYIGGYWQPVAEILDHARLRKYISRATLAWAQRSSLVTFEDRETSVSDFSSSEFSESSVASSVQGQEIFLQHTDRKLRKVIEKTIPRFTREVNARIAKQSSMSVLNETLRSMLEEAICNCVCRQYAAYLGECASSCFTVKVLENLQRKGNADRVCMTEKQLKARIRAAVHE
eukprot:gnl/Chilomastix_cuspidata/3409.p1 GENE.gnl/Chilomastix_cuspidata/3409~~gnl/Chilomastix_cuspidata/3409.p1  ORF type:complete len:915 (-),score=448.99 gnl/Chilomastix_cuspidata/3409:1097-3841(-)